jgi:hypothetical protein
MKSYQLQDHIPEAKLNNNQIPHYILTGKANSVSEVIVSRLNDWSVIPNDNTGSRAANLAYQLVRIRWLEHEGKTQLHLVLRLKMYETLPFISLHTVVTAFLVREGTTFTFHYNSAL